YSPLNTLPVSTQMYLYPGEQIMRFTVLTDEEPFNIDRFIFELATNRSQLKNVNSKFFRAYQNRNNELIIKQENYAKTDYFQLFTINGKLKKTIALPEPETRISTLQITPGTYIIHAISGKNSFSQKIIIR
ncbi:MAG: T9SS type A sorting domain-containing protein, partial [Tangfeifania sp.]